MADLPEGFDLEALLAPIPGDAPQGTDIREDFSATSPYNRLRDARSEARDAERGQDKGEAEAGDPDTAWRTVRELALKTLTETTKDLEVAAWLTEAMVRSHGLAGLAAGAQVMGGLAERYWDGVFPLPDEDGMETRVSPVTGLNGRDGNGSLMQPLYKVVLFTRRQDDTPVAFYQFQQAEKLSTTAADASRGVRGIGRRMRTPPTTVCSARVLADAWAARDAWQAMANVLDAKAGADGPSTTAVRDLLSRIIDIARRYAPADALAAAAGETAAGEAAEAAAPGGAPASVADRRARTDGLARGRAAGAGRDRQLLPPHRAALADLLYAGRGGAPRPPELAGTAGRRSSPTLNTRNGILNMLGIRPPPPEASAMRRTDGGASVKQRHRQRELLTVVVSAV